MIGHIHSVESMGLVDGPGVRAVVFLQGCSLRCRYCHNPDTWAAGGTEFTPEALTAKLLRFRPYFSRGGGVTFSGGDPLLQPEFLAEMPPASTPAWTLPALGWGTTAPSCKTRIWCSTT